MVIKQCVSCGLPWVVELTQKAARIRIQVTAIFLGFQDLWEEIARFSNVHSEVNANVTKTEQARYWTVFDCFGVFALGIYISIGVGK